MTSQSDEIDSFIPWKDLSNEEIELRVLKCALVNEPLYNSIRDVFIGHKYPEKLDHVGRQLYDIFNRLNTVQDP